MSGGRHRDGGLADREEDDAPRDEDELASAGVGDGPDDDGVAAPGERLRDEPPGVHGGDRGTVEGPEEGAGIQGSANSIRIGGGRRRSARIEPCPDRALEVTDAPGRRRQDRRLHPRERDERAGRRPQDVVEDVADKIEDALEKAGTEGRKLQREVKEELSRRWKQVDRVGRENAFVMAAGALAVGVLIGWLVARDRRD